MRIGIIIIVALAAIALIGFLIVRNRKDRKELLPPGATDDPVEERRMDDQRGRDKV
ncbi:hypothetical protein SAMN05660461_2886 [Chitinophaga ginsengisegetis]|uniref:Uncharacterized protein n=1 Tax=Chitinophaga ginsengisegetis TaxID=393003 RepID=A0A1T5NWU4_9BACT|nr:hypothetical protein [Chitinophaga ginsengisegetis]MDR6567371.1 hypothetical protein [Chitinophaga ginsengisegetis]MDR6647102.1 hypothetical protein [Chitinophaga ginsengisegetis]MDR6653451.1 hypothetical protein [Chitinophaga ginsengisegetis]SKD04589.1 hypothetical protein SAMN05660461_2886 [Chitinophaga ginsengisegetis]